MNIRTARMEVTAVDMYVVDRDPVLIAMLRTFVEKHGHRVTTHGSIRELIAGLQAARKPPDAVLLDLSSVGGDANEAEMLPSQYPQIRWVLMSTEGAKLPPGTALAHGEASHLRKPIRLSDVEALFAQEPERKFPWAPAPQPEPETPQGMDVATARRNLRMRILIVDDSPLIHKMYRSIINDHYPHATIFGAFNGKEALEVLSRDGHMDVVLLDIHMPVMGGLSFLDALSTQLGPANMPVIVVTTEGKQEEVINSLRRGARGYLVKPFNGDVLCGMIDVVLSRSL